MARAVIYAGVSAMHRPKGGVIPGAFVNRRSRVREKII
jgi:hypothetical protein